MYIYGAHLQTKAIYGILHHLPLVIGPVHSCTVSTPREHTVLQPFDARAYFGVKRST